MTVASDHITINALSVHLANGLGADHSAFALDSAPPCPVELTLRIDLFDGIVQSDEDTMLGLGVNYSEVSKQVYALVSDRERRWTLETLMVETAGVPLKLRAVKGVQVDVRLPRALLTAKAARYTRYFTRDGGQDSTLGIEALDVRCIIGLHPHERAEKQRLEVDLELKPWDGVRAKVVADMAVQYLEQSSFGTIESLTHSLAEDLLTRLRLPGVELSVTLRKPSALPFAVPSITITRSSHNGAVHTPTASTSSTSTSNPRIFLALGSNIEPRVAHLQRAVTLLSEYGLSLVSTGRMYESEPMYHTDQARFLNSAIEVSTSVSAQGGECTTPMGVLRVLKRVEREVGREKTFENGPRKLDVDLIYYGTEQVKEGKKGDKEVDGVGWLEVPHWGVGEREFVLRPLCDIDPTFVDPNYRQTLSSLLSRLPTRELAPVIPFPTPLRLDSLTVMGIFNATPDSFSDGSLDRLNVDSAINEVDRLFDQPFPPSILDIGGMSTRPNSTPCSEEEEISRVVPLIQAIRSQERYHSLPISIDTYRPAVARAAVQAGANCINDVWGGRSEGMLQVMAELDVPVVLMHSRGDSGSMTSDDAQRYEEGVVRGVREEMGDVIERALKAGVKRWNIVIDPGLGFAKTPRDSLVLLRNLTELIRGKEDGNGEGEWKRGGLRGYPLLIGASRKGFVGKVVQRDVPAERGFGDAAVIAWCAGVGVGAGGVGSESKRDSEGVVSVVRVHDVRAAGEVLAMLKAIKEA